MEPLNSCKYFIKLVSLSSVHLKRACEVAIYVLEMRNSPGRSIKISSWVGKMSIIWKIKIEISSRVT